MRDRTPTRSIHSDISICGNSGNIYGICPPRFPFRPPTNQGLLNNRFIFNSSAGVRHVSKAQRCLAATNSFGSWKRSHNSTGIVHGPYQPSTSLPMGLCDPRCTTRKSCSYDIQPFQRLYIHFPYYRFLWEFSHLILKRC
jgi:hypothetical protein